MAEEVNIMTISATDNICTRIEEFKFQCLLQRRLGKIFLKLASRGKKLSKPNFLLMKYEGNVYAVPLGESQLDIDELVYLRNVSGQNIGDGYTDRETNVL